MIIRLVKMHFKDQKTDAFLSIFDESHTRIRAFPGCRKLKLVRDIHDPSIFFTISEWESEMALSSYRESLLFRETWKKTRLLFAERAQAWSTEVYTPG